MIKSKISQYNRNIMILKEEQKLKNRLISLSEEQAILDNDIKSKRDADDQKREMKLAHRDILQTQNKQLIDDRKSGHYEIDLHKRASASINHSILKGSFAANQLETSTSGSVRQQLLSGATHQNIGKGKKYTEETTNRFKTLIL